MVHLDYRDSRPIYTQIIDGFREQIATGVLLPGEKLPSSRRGPSAASSRSAPSHRQSRGSGR